MRTSILLAFAGSLLSAKALNLVAPRDGAAPRVVEHSIQRRDIEYPREHDRKRMQQRSGTVNVGLQNEETLYFMNVSIGTPPQDLRLHIDTGSSDLWVNVASSSLCEESTNPCAASGVYNANDSSTYHYLNSDFNISYVDGTGSSGDYATDVVRFADVTFSKQQFGIGYTSSTQEGVVGIGYITNEVSLTTYGQTYANIPKNLLDHGYVKSNAYSLWLNDLDASTGSILFGGVNTAKYTGSLDTVPIIAEDGEYIQFIIALTAVGTNGNADSVASNIAQPALLDSGSSLMYLPNDITKKIYDLYDAKWDSSHGLAVVNCDLAHSSDTIDLTFSKPTISVALSEIVLLGGISSNGKPICILGIAPADGGVCVLGDTFLRSAYVVYDMDNNEISLAQTDFNSTGNNIMEITNTVPDATLVPNAVTTVATVSGGVRLSDGSPSGSHSPANPTAAVGYNIALLGAAGAALLAL